MRTKDPEKEKLLRDWWANQSSVRETAEATGVPEGTVASHYARFNKEGKSEYRELMLQFSAVQSMREFQGARPMFDKLLAEGKYDEAKSYAEAILAWQRLLFQVASQTP